MLLVVLVQLVVLVVLLLLVLLVLMVGTVLADMLWAGVLYGVPQASQGRSRGRGRGRSRGRSRKEIHPDMEGNHHFVVPDH